MSWTPRPARTIAACAVAAALVAAPAVSSTAAGGRPFPETIALPADFSPEGITGGWTPASAPASPPS